MVLVLWYVLLLALLLVSILAIRKNEWLGRKIEWLFALDAGSAYKAKKPHSLYVMGMKWPMLLALLGLIIPTPLIWDAILGFALGAAFQFYRWTQAKADEAVKSGPVSGRTKTA